MSQVDAPSRHAQQVPAHQRLYPPIALVAITDIVLTARILQLGGSEVNAVANAILERAGLPGLALLKLLTVAVVFACCELIARRDQRLAFRLAEWAIAINFIPVAVALWQILHIIL